MRTNTGPQEALQILTVASALTHGQFNRRRIMSTQPKQVEVTICAPMEFWQALRCLREIVLTDMQQQYFANPTDILCPGTFTHSFNVVDTYLHGLWLDGRFDGNK